MPMAEFYPSRIYIVRKLWEAVEQAKDLEDAKKRFRDAVTSLLLDQAPDAV